MRRMQQFFVGVMLAGMSLGTNAEAQGPGQSGAIQTFHFANLTDANAEADAVLALRDVLPPETKLKQVSSTHSVVIWGNPEQIGMAIRALRELDQVQPMYRLSFAITESDAGKKVGVQRSSIVVSTGQRNSLKQGSKVPIATGSFDGGKNGSQTQFTYLDVGLNFDLTLDQTGDGVRLRSKVEQSAIAEERTIVGVNEPIIRQTVLEGTSMLVPGKPLVLGSLDVSGSTRHLDVEVTMEPMK